ncbi:AbgT family transporter [Serratia marcescens]
MSEATTPINKSPGRVFYWVERIGNKIPNPFLLFVYLILVLMLATALFSWLDVAVKNPATGELIKVNNLMSVAGMQWIFPNIIHNFSSFAPLGAILALVIGAGLAEKVGLLQALMYKMASRVSARYASYMVLFIAFFSHISSDAALAAIAGVASGFTANLLIVTTDVLLSGISTEATKAVDGAVHVSVIDNWYFMATSVIVLTIAGALLTDKFIEPRLPKWQGGAEDKIAALTPLQNRGLMMSGIAALVFIAIIAALVVPEAAPLRDPNTGSVIPSPFIKGIVPIIILFFFTVAITYGVVTKQIRRPDDIPHHLLDPMKSMAGFIVMVFPLSQFVAFFNWSNMGKFMAVGLTDMLEAAGMSGAPAFLGLMFLSAFLCMFIASGSAIWSILAPIFVPMFMLLGFHPAFAQMIFRIADSAVLPLAPMSPFLPLFLGFLQRYRKDAQLGTYYVLILPYPVVFFSVWILLLLVWYALGLPIGPGVYPKLG